MLVPASVTWYKFLTHKATITNNNKQAHATEQNADEVDGNTYIWKYDENTKDKNFYLKISKSALEESKKNYIKNQEIKKNRSKIINIGIIVGVILLIACVIFVFYKKYKKNNFDYE